MIAVTCFKASDSNLLLMLVAVSFDAIVSALLIEVARTVKFTINLVSRSLRRTATEVMDEMLTLSLEVSAARAMPPRKLFCRDVLNSATVYGNVTLICNPT